MPSGAAAVPPQDQDQLLDVAMREVKRNAFAMKRALDQDSLMEGVKHASTMLLELRTNVMSPKTYYELYMTIADELRHLEAHLVDQFGRGNKVTDLYELVQYAGNIVPRLYLLVTVGSVYIKTGHTNARGILNDLVEMCRGVQHPLRGLFLRFYLLSCVKSNLPEGSDTAHGTLTDSIEFILLNFGEMNKLWVRMQHQGHSRNRKRREGERKELRLLVGNNLVRMSNLDGVDVDRYREVVLPRILEQVVNCRDAIAQEYLMECIIQVFPDEFHLACLGELLAPCGKLAPAVNVKNVVIALVERLASYAQREGIAAIPSDLALFDVFAKQVKEIIEARPELPPADALALEGALVNLALRVYPDKVEYVDGALGQAEAFLTKAGLDEVESGTPVATQLTRLLRLLVEVEEGSGGGGGGSSSGSSDGATRVLDLEHFGGLVSHLAYTQRHEMAIFLLESLVKSGTQLRTVEHVSAFFDLIAPLVAEQEDADPAVIGDEEDFAAEQTLVGRFISLLGGETPDVTFQVLVHARKQLGTGGESRVRFTLPPLLFQAFRLARVYYQAREQDDKWEKKLDRIYKFCHKTISALAAADLHEMALRLFLQAALAVNSTPFEKAEAIAYEYFSQAFQLYEEEIGDSKAQASAITLLVASLETMACFSEENYTPLAKKCAMISSKTLRKQDQCRGVSLCTNLFWSGTVVVDKQAGEEEEEEEEAAEGEEGASKEAEPVRDGKQVLACLQRASKVADKVMDTTTQVALFVEILNTYVLFYERNCESVTLSYVQKVVGLINGRMANLDEGEDTAHIRTHFSNTLKYIEQRKSQPVEGKKSFAGFKA